MEAFLVSTGVVALGEMGDKTQLLAILLAAKLRRPVPIILGILVATLVNHAFAGLVGDWVAKALGPDILRWVIGGSFIGMAGWMLRCAGVVDSVQRGQSLLKRRRCMSAPCPFHRRPVNPPVSAGPCSVA